MSARPNSLQAVLEREAAAVSAESVAVESPQIVEPLNTRLPKAVPKPKVARAKRPSRDGRRFLGGHFEPSVVKQMRMLAAEEETTVQALLEEAVDLLFLKKGRGRIVRV